MRERVGEPPARPFADLLKNYQQSDEVFDEVLGEDGRPRAHYEPLLSAIENFEPGEWRRRLDGTQRLVEEQGISYNVYTDPVGTERPWPLDPVPLIIPAAEWRELRAGLIQRATLLNRILEDGYGPQELIRSGWLSPALVFAQPDFLRPCHGIRVPEASRLTFYAADLARAPDGRWWVTSDRTQIPTGMGYALANRVVTSRVLPEAFRDNHVERLAGFFRTVRHTLAHLSPRGETDARVVMLTPGPRNETYFEQAYLARYLGYTLVEGQDLTVRDERVFLKTLAGLEPIDVILRRVDDDFCDPLELRNDSILGVPGLVEAIRAGNVALANSLGSGLVQNPAFMSFLPGLSRHVLGEELLLPSLATWWCGQRRAREYVLEHLKELHVRPAFRTDRLLPTKPEELRKAIEFDPDLYVAQEEVELANAGIWDPSGLAARPISFRVFVVLGPNGYEVMPGGFTRVSPDAGGRFISLQTGGATKDTWVLADGPVTDNSILRETAQRVELRRTSNNLPSRLADNFFWLGRYAERADASARLLRSALLRFNPERSGKAPQPTLLPLLKTLAVQGQLPDPDKEPELYLNAEAFEAELLAAIFDPAHNGSLRQIAEQLQRLAVVVRDRTSNDMWRVLDHLHSRFAHPTSHLVLLAGDAVGVLTQTLLNLAAFHGLARENMTRAQAWRFIDMGLRLERAVYLGTLLDSTLHAPDPENPSLLETVLEVADSSITFRTRYNLIATVPAVFDLLLLDDKNPRSLLFQFQQLMKHFNKLPTEREDAEGSGKHLVRQILSSLERTDARELAGPVETWASSELADVVSRTLLQLPRISNALAANYFAHSAISRTGRDSEG